MMPTQLASPTLDFTVADQGYRLRLVSDTDVHADSGWWPGPFAAFAALGSKAMPFLDRLADRHDNPLPDAD